MSLFSDILAEVAKHFPGPLKDWLGEGGMPVEPQLAEKRSLACVYGNSGLPCHHNVEPNWWERFKNKIALAIRDQLAIKHKLGLFVSKENEIGMCRACGCCLRLKVWTPISHIKTHLADNEIAELPSFCWIKSEITQ